MATCQQCERDFTGWHAVLGSTYCPDCRRGSQGVPATRQGSDPSKPQAGLSIGLAEQAKTIALTTESTPPSPNLRRLGLVTGTCIYGQHFGRDIANAVTDLVGGRSKTSENLYTQARNQALEDLRVEAAQLGATMVFALTIEHREISGGSKSMVMVTAIGTAATDERQQ
jgi:uncharacterized protein YbjQ (UPF0145 family)